MAIAIHGHQHGLTLGWGFSGLTSHLKINPGKIWIILDNPDLHFSAF
jgi:hypothetical protein